MQFKENDIGPFYVSAKERDKRKYDKKVGTKEVS
jgi:hypothetical protein